jgi:predicted nucleic acid-binding protein
LLVAAHQQASHDWWREQRAAFDCYVSQIVLDEISAGDAEAAEARIRLIEGLPVLGATEPAERLTEAILADGAIPARAVRDAAHIAVAAAHGIDYLLTWNCKHLANAQIMRKVSAVCEVQGFRMPLICTPEELMGE